MCGETGATRVSQSGLTWGVCGLAAREHEKPVEKVWITGCVWGHYTHSGMFGNYGIHRIVRPKKS